MQHAIRVHGRRASSWRRTEHSRAVLVRFQAALLQPLRPNAACLRIRMRKRCVRRQIEAHDSVLGGCAREKPTKALLITHQIVIYRVDVDLELGAGYRHEGPRWRPAQIHGAMPLFITTIGAALNDWVQGAVMI